MNLRGPWILIVESWSLKLEPLRGCKPMVAVSHHFEEQDSDPDPHQSKKPDQYQTEKRDPDPGDVDPQHRLKLGVRFY